MMIRNKDHRCLIGSWQQFHEQIRLQGRPLLKRLDEFPGSILVGGSQRSGTTMVTVFIIKTANLAQYWSGPVDSELEGALILSGDREHKPQGRYCFQTTYLNENYREYYQHQNGHKMVWMIRNPFSVVYSMVYNWKREAVRRIFKGLGLPLATSAEKMRYRLLGSRGVGLIKQACYIYRAKSLQLFELKNNLDQDRLLVIDYDDLVTKKEIILPLLYEFLGLDYDSRYLDKIHTKSKNKAHLLSQRNTSIIKSLCQATYEEAKKLTSLKF